MATRESGRRDGGEGQWRWEKGDGMGESEYRERGREGLGESRESRLLSKP